MKSFKKIYKLDMLGKKCPIPVLKISKKYREISEGEIINVKVDDPKAENDVEELAKNINIKILKKKLYKDYLLITLKKI